MPHSLSTIALISCTMKKFKLLLVLALALTLISLLCSSRISIFQLAAFTALREPRVERPVLVDGIWQLPDAAFGPGNNASIPRILHQAFKSEMIYSNYLPMIRSCLTLNPDWKYFLWRDSDAEAFIASSYPEFLPRYKGYKDNLERADSIRYIVLHHFGGIYIDMDVECRQPFFPALSRLPAFVDQERIEQSNILWSMPFSAMNSAMGSVPGHQFFRFMIDAMLRYPKPGNAFDSTGPRLLTQKYTEYCGMTNVTPIAIMEPRVFSPLMDGQKNWRHMCSRHLRGLQLGHPAKGCRTLADKQWSMDDTDNATLAVHRFLHLGYRFMAQGRQRLASLMLAFPDRVNFYKSSSIA